VGYAGKWTGKDGRTMKTLACRDTGTDCDWKASAATEQELLDKAAQHVKSDHHMDLTPEMIEAARKVIRDA
jgi:predicted small metal-binding protein